MRQTSELASEVAWVIAYISAGDKTHAVHLLEMGIGPLLVRCA